MIRYVIFLLLGLAGSAICIAGFYFGQKIPFAQQWPLFEALRNTAAIIFAVVGAWLAIIYPERLKISFGRSPSIGGSGNDNVGLLLTPAVHSTIILVCLLMIGILAPLMKQIPGVLAHVEILRGVSFFILALLTQWQVAIVIVTIIPADLIKSNFDREQSERNMIAAQNSLVQRAPRDG
jgi:hypothetical protein